MSNKNQGYAELKARAEALKAQMEEAPEPGGMAPPPPQRKPKPQPAPAPAAAAPAAAAPAPAAAPEGEEGDGDGDDESAKATEGSVSLFTVESLKALIGEVVAEQLAKHAEQMTTALAESSKSIDERLDALKVVGELQVMEMTKSFDTLRTTPAASPPAIGVAAANRRPAGAAAADRMSPPAITGGAEITKAIAELGETYKAALDTGAASRLTMSERMQLVLPAQEMGRISVGNASHFVNHGEWPAGVNAIEAAKAVKACGEAAAKIEANTPVIL